MDSSNDTLTEFEINGHDDKLRTEREEMKELIAEGPVVEHTGNCFLKLE